MVEGFIPISCSFFMNCKNLFSIGGGGGLEPPQVARRRICSPLLCLSVTAQNTNFQKLVVHSIPFVEKNDQAKNH